MKVIPETKVKIKKEGSKSEEKVNLNAHIIQNRFLQFYRILLCNKKKIC